MYFKLNNKLKSLSSKQHTNWFFLCNIGGIEPKFLTLPIIKLHQNQIIIIIIIKN